MGVKALIQEYAETEAGKELATKGFHAVHVGYGLVVSRYRRWGVCVDVVAATGTAPRNLTDAVEVRFCDGDQDDALVLSFPHLSDFLATLK